MPFPSLYFARSRCVPALCGAAGWVRGSVALCCPWGLQSLWAFPGGLTPGLPRREGALQDLFAAGDPDVQAEKAWRALWLCSLGIESGESLRWVAPRYQQITSFNWEVWRWFQMPHLTAVSPRCAQQHSLLPPVPLLLRFLPSCLMPPRL